MSVLALFSQPWTRRAGLFLFVLFLCGALRLSAQTIISKEYQIKAVCLFNFAQFVKWPSGAFVNADTPFRIGILGNDPFGTFLDETVRGEKVDGHPLVIERYKNVEDAKDCQILFISQSEKEKIESILTDLKGRNILTVGDMEGFNKSGGVIRFFMQENKIHLMVNLKAAKNDRLSISSKVLRLAEIVEPEKE
jgi:hypothetical protein